MKKKLVKRLHDEFYMNENRYEEPKEAYKVLLKELDKKKFKSLMDVGCANGELLYYLDQKLKNVNFTGIDVLQNLLDKAKKNCNNDIVFLKKDISKKNLKVGKFDRIILSGVLSIFDNPEMIIKNLLGNLNKNGKLYIFGAFNPNPYNVLVKYEDVKKDKNVYQSGWNIFSLDTMKLIAKKNNKKMKAIEFKMPFDIKKRKNDLIRTWTVEFEGKRQWTNGLGIIYHGYWVEIS
jgi:SAM-dependent methyltransferase|tara:strand:+ start:302 stop:1003 length:702 start_codon:yes stop_codon:yes gene_type:complete